VYCCGLDSAVSEQNVIADLLEDDNFQFPKRAEKLVTSDMSNCHFFLGNIKYLIVSRGFNPPFLPKAFLCNETFF
jgi:hypothetical protein